MCAFANTEGAIREAILNALIHKDYTSPSSINLRVHDQIVSIWNSGELEHLKVEDLSKDHDSHKRNPLITEMFFRAGYIEAWGRGTLMIIDEITKSGLSKPEFEVRQKGLKVTFQRNPMLFTEYEVPVILWDKNGNGKDIKIPDFKALRKNDIMFVLPKKEEVVKEVKRELKKAKFENALFKPEEWVGFLLTPTTLQ